MAFKRAVKRRNLKEKIKQLEQLIRIHKPLAQGIMMLQQAYMEGFKAGEQATLAGIKAPVTPPASILSGLKESQRAEIPVAVGAGNSNVELSKEPAD